MTTSTQLGLIEDIDIVVFLVVSLRNTACSVFQGTNSIELSLVAVARFADTKRHASNTCACLSLSPLSCPSHFCGMASPLFFRAPPPRSPPRAFLQGTSFSSGDFLLRALSCATSWIRPCRRTWPAICKTSLC